MAGVILMEQAAALQLGHHQAAEILVGAGPVGGRQDEPVAYLGPEPVLVHEVDPADLQAKTRLTAEGRQSVMELIAMLKASEADALGSFDPSEVQLFKHLLSRVGQG